ncbi:MAG: adenylate cyclase [Actinomycetes bacterium]
MTPKAPEPELVSEQFAEMMELVKDSKSVELKLTIPAESHRAAITALGIDPLDGQIRLVTFFDTPDLTLNQAGVVVRARRIQGKGADSVVKLRPVVPNDLPAELRVLPTFGIEVDAMPGGFVCSASFKGVTDPDQAKLVTFGQGPVRKVFNKQQRAFYKAHAPEGLGLDDLSLLGPIFVVKVPFTPQELAHKLVAELWLYPDGSRILELSTKSTPAGLFEVLSNVRHFLIERGIDRHGEQQTKTRRALDFFAKDLKAARAE